MPGMSGFVWSMPRQLQHGRLQVVDVDAVLDDVEAEFVGLPDRGAGLDAAAGEPHVYASG